MIVVSEVGMVTSVGRDAHTTLTSILSGIARPKELGYFTVVDPELQEPQGVVGHPIEALTEGFHLFGLWIRVGVKCLEDLLRRASVTLGQGAPLGHRAPLGARAALIAVTPDIRSARFMSEGDESAESLRAPFLDRLAAWLGVPAEQSYAVAAGSTGLFHALELADAMLERRSVDRVVVLAVDSLLDTLTLEWLATAQRLKSPSAPAGLMPGEAGAALLLERPGGAGLGVAVRALAAEVSAAGASAASRASAAAGASATPEGAAAAEETGEARGARLARVIERCLAQAADESGAGCMLVSDQNGEQWRAEEVGYSSLLLGDAWPAHAQIVLPALSLGDTGAASAALGCCVGALALGFAPAGVRESLVVASTIEGSAGAALLARAH